MIYHSVTSMDLLEDLAYTGDGPNNKNKASSREISLLTVVRVP